MAHGISLARASLTFQGPGDVHMSLITLFAGDEGAGASSLLPVRHPAPPTMPLQEGKLRQVGTDLPALALVPHRGFWSLDSPHGATRSW